MWCVAFNDPAVLLCCDMWGHCKASCRSAWHCVVLPYTMLCCSVWCVWRSMVLYWMVWCGIQFLSDSDIFVLSHCLILAEFVALLCGMVLHCNVSCRKLVYTHRYNTTHHNATQYNAAQYIIYNTWHCPRTSPVKWRQDNTQCTDVQDTCLFWWSAFLRPYLSAPLPPRSDVFHKMQDKKIDTGTKDKHG